MLQTWALVYISTQWTMAHQLLPTKWSWNNFRLLDTKQELPQKRELLFYIKYFSCFPALIPDNLSATGPMAGCNRPPLSGALLSRGDTWLSAAGFSVVLRILRGGVKQMETCRHSIILRGRASWPSRFLYRRNRQTGHAAITEMIIIPQSRVIRILLYFRMNFSRHEFLGWMMHFAILHGFFGHSRVCFNQKMNLFPGTTPLRRFIIRIKIFQVAGCFVPATAWMIILRATSNDSRLRTLLLSGGLLSM